MVNIKNTCTLHNIYYLCNLNNLFNKLLLVINKRSKNLQISIFNVKMIYYFFLLLTDI